MQMRLKAATLSLMFLAGGGLAQAQDAPALEGFWIATDPIRRLPVIEFIEIENGKIRNGVIPLFTDPALCKTKPNCHDPVDLTGAVMQFDRRRFTISGIVGADSAVVNVENVSKSIRPRLFLRKGRYRYRLRDNTLRLTRGRAARRFIRTTRRKATIASMPFWVFNSNVQANYRCLIRIQGKEEVLAKLERLKPFVDLRIKSANSDNPSSAQKLKLAGDAVILRAALQRPYSDLAMVKAGSISSDEVHQILAQNQVTAESVSLLTELMAKNQSHELHPAVLCKVKKKPRRKTRRRKRRRS